MLVSSHRSGLLDRKGDGCSGAGIEDGSRRAPPEKFYPTREIPLSLSVGMELRQRQLQSRDGLGTGKDRVPRVAQRTRGKTEPGRVDGDRSFQFYGGGGCRSLAYLRYLRHQDV